MAHEITSVYTRGSLNLIPEIKDLITDLPFEFQSWKTDDPATSQQDGYLLTVRSDGKDGIGSPIAMLETLPGSAEGRILVNAFEVMSQHRSQGIGSRMFLRFLDETRLNGKTLELDCRSELIPFYRRMAVEMPGTPLSFTVSAGTNVHQEYRVTIGPGKAE